MASDPSPPAPTPPQRVRKRVLIPSILLGLVVIVFLVLYGRGTWVEPGEVNPATPAVGAVTQLYRDGGGNIFVRSAILVKAPPRAVWPVVIDYASQANFLPYVSQLSSEELDEHRYRIRGVAHSRIWGDWPFESEVRHDEKPDAAEYIASWAEEDRGELAVNRGRWTVRAAGKGQSLLAFALQVEVRHAPNFLVRNILMDRLPSVVRAVGAEVERRGPP